MALAPAAVTDPDRLAALRRLVLLDSPPNPTFDRLTVLAAQLLEAPVALLTLVDADRQFFVSACGLPEPLQTARQTPLDYSICQYAVANQRPLIIGDAHDDPFLAANLAVTELGVTAYAGMPLVTSDGYAVGTLCVIDFVARDWTDDQLTILTHLADITMDEIRLHFLDRLAARRRQWRGVGLRSGSSD
jgi:GAF domain-containing protein